MDQKALYLHSNQWNESMCDKSDFNKLNYFPTKELALAEFFNMCPNDEIVDECSEPHETLNKLQETWRDRPSLL